MKILIIGANGQLGTDILKALRNEETIPLIHQDIEVTDLASVKTAIDEHEPDVVINTSAYHNILDCEKYPQNAFSVNAIGAKNLATICKEKGLKLVHASTDYVFDGKKKTPYTEDDPPNPVNTYGVSKIAGEYFIKEVKDHYIVRVASIYGVTGCRAKGGLNFVETMLKLSKTRDVVQVTSNIVCSPTYTHDAAEKIREILLDRYLPGIYNIANSGNCTWYDFAVEVFRLSGIHKKIEPRQDSEDNAGFVRPLYSPLISKKLKPMRHWREALKAYLEERADISGR